MTRRAPLTVFGIRNCDTVRAARKWLAENGIEYRFHDFRRDGFDGEILAPWLRQHEMAHLVNRRGRTWRSLALADRQAIETGHGKSLVIDQPTLIRRPVFDCGGRIMIGFDADIRAALESID